MTIHHVWQGGPDGSGVSESDTRRTVPNGAPGDLVLFKRGTVFVATSQLAIVNAVTWGAFGDESLPRPVIESTAAVWGSINVANAGPVTRFRDIHFRNFLSHSANGAAITSAVTNGRACSLDIRRCKFEAIQSNAVRINGTNTASAALSFVCLDNEFDDIGEDCVFGAALDYEFGRNRCTRLSIRAGTGDAVGFINGDPVRVHIHGNYIDHSDVDSRQCVIIDSTTPGAGLCIIEDNVMIGFGSPTVAPVNHIVVISKAATIMRRNTFVGYGLIGGVNTADDEVTDNLFLVGNVSSLGAPLSMMSSGLLAGNTIVATHPLPATRSAVTVAGAGARIHGNAFVGLPVGVRSDIPSNPTMSHNAYWNVAQPRIGAGGAFAESGAVTSDPLLDGKWRPRLGSPLRRAGLALNTRTDRAGRLRAAPPAIGAFEGAER
jgi:hypothetical protein